MIKRYALIFCTILPILAALSVEASMQVIFSDNFNRADLGDDWNVSNSNNIRITNNVLNITDPNNGIYMVTTKPLTFIDYVLINFSFKHVNPALNEINKFGLSNISAEFVTDVTDSIAGFGTRTDQTLQDDAGTKFMSYTIGVWYDASLKINLSARTYDIYINDVLKSSDVPFYDSREGLNRFSITTHDSTSDTSWEIDDVIIMAESSDNPMKINLTFPTSKTNYWTAENISGTCRDDDDVSAVFINDSRFNLTSNNPYNWSYIYTGNESTNITVKITCTDGNLINTSKTFNISFDIIHPYCFGLSHQTIEKNFSFDWNITCIDDINLYSLNVSCTGGSNFKFFRMNINQTSFNFINETGPLNSTTTCTFITTDAHTKNYIKDKLNKVNTRFKDNKLKIPDLDILEFTNNSIDIKKFDLIFYDDRISFNTTFKIKGNDKKNVKKRISVIIRGNHSVEFINNKLYNGWFVVDNKYWIDFNTVSDPVHIDVYRVNKKTYEVYITTEKDNIFFNSLGIVNTNTQVQKIDVKEKTLPFMVDISSLEGVLILFILSFLYIGVMFIGLFFNNSSFVSLGFFIGIAIGFVLISVHGFLTLAFIFINIMISMGQVKRNE